MYRLIHGSAHDIDLPDGSVHCVVTSPPYWGLRKYAGVQAIEWPGVDYAPMPGLAPLHIHGCEPGCEHEWADGPVKTQQPQRDNNPDGNKPGAWFGSSRGENSSRKGAAYDITQGAYCVRCGGWRGDLGLEPTPEIYIGHLMLVMRELWRVLRDDGVAFINLGDSYNGGSGSGGKTEKQITNHGSLHDGGIRLASGLKPKDLCLIPYRFALAAQADGWYVRSDIIWAKPNPMPESVRDRPTKAHEYIYLLAKRERYYYDADAVRETATKGRIILPNAVPRTGRKASSTAQWRGVGTATEDIERGSFWSGQYRDPDSGRNKRTVWTVATQPYAEAHFATYPEKLVEPMILAGTSARGVCPACGKPWERVVERTQYTPEVVPNGHRNVDESRGDKTRKLSGEDYNKQASSITTGWRPGCMCDAGGPVPATILDPFCGSGTTGKVALSLGREFVGVDMSDEYLTELVPERMGNVQIELPI